MNTKLSLHSSMFRKFHPIAKSLTVCRSAQPTWNCVRRNSNLTKTQPNDLLDRVEAQLATAKEASDAFAEYDQSTVDYIFKQIAHTANKHRVQLAKSAFNETRMGLFEDKVIKNGLISELVYDKYKDMKTCGIVEKDDYLGIEKIAYPVGLTVCITPCTNPTSTAITKSLFLAKTRNAGIFLPHPRAINCTNEAIEICYEAGVKAGAPPGFLQCVTTINRQVSEHVMNHNYTKLILATGGPSMVRASYSTGHPAIGVGSGNAPVLIDDTADLAAAVSGIVLGKSFDNGVICAAEQSVVIVEKVYDQVIQKFKERGVYFLHGKDKKLLSDNFLTKEHTVNPDIVGQSAQTIAKLFGITNVPSNAVVLGAEIEKIGLDEPLSHEKLSPILSFFKAKDTAHGIQICKQIANFGGVGHTAGIYSSNDDTIQTFSHHVPVGRALVNMPTSLSAIGSSFNFNISPTMTIGCGTLGGSSASSNVTPDSLLNYKTIAKKAEHTEWFQNPPQIFFNRDCLTEALESISRYYDPKHQLKKAIVVTDKFMCDLGYIKRVVNKLELLGFKCEIFDDVLPDPDMNTVRAGIKVCNHFKPDLMICVGGGSSMDAGKFIRAVYEHPDLTLDDCAARFVEYRKRTFRFPNFGSKIKKLVCIPTTSGTGSEVTPFCVITDDDGHKYPIMSYRFTPDIAIIDSSFCDKLPKSLIANAGIDALTHAIEAYVSVISNDFTQSQSLRAIKLILDYIEQSYHGSESSAKPISSKTKYAREKVHHGASIAGLAFSNSFVGITHSLSHQIGAIFHLPHGLINAILMVHVIKYNAVANPTRMGIYPTYDKPMSIQRYANIARHIGLNGENKNASDMDLVKALCDKILTVMTSIEMPLSFEQCGIDKNLYFQRIDEMAEKAFDDQCTPANPRFPLVDEMKLILEDAFYGKLK